MMAVVILHMAFNGASHSRPLDQRGLAGGAVGHYKEPLLLADRRATGENTYRSRRLLLMPMCCFPRAIIVTGGLTCPLESSRYSPRELHANSP